MKIQRLILTGGGTGGHIYPALAVAKEFKKRNPKIEILFVGSKQKLDRKILENSDYNYKLLGINGFNRVSILKKLIFALKLPLVLLQAILLWLRFKPDLVIGFGGFASFPLVFVSSLFKGRTYMWEANAYPGMVTRKFADKVEGVFCAFPSKKLNYPNIIKSGVPNRFESEQVQAYIKKGEALKILVVGGSQGSKKINEVCIELWNKINQSKSKLKLTDLSVVHQSGALSFNHLKQQFQDFPNHFVLKEYIHDMKSELETADIVISRTGAGGISDICTFGRASILIPLSTSADDHQKKNAIYLEERGAAIVIEEKDLNSDVLESKILELKVDPDKVSQMGTAASQIFPDNISQSIVDYLVSK